MDVCADWACVDPEPKVTSGQLVGGDCDEDAVNLEQKVFFLGVTVEGGGTGPVQEDTEDTNCASSDSLSPDLGEYGCPQSPL